MDISLPQGTKTYRNVWIAISIIGNYVSLLAIASGSLNRHQISLLYINLLFIPVRSFSCPSTLHHTDYGGLYNHSRPELVEMASHISSSMLLKDFANR